MIIPYYSNGVITKRCIESIIKHSRNYRIIATSDGSASGEIQIVEKTLKNSEEYLHLFNPVNTGFPPNVNRGLKATMAEFIAIINNDVEIYGDWLPALENEYLRWGKKCFIGKVGMGISKAVTNITSPTFPEVDYLCGFLIFSSKECFDKVGLFDENFEIGYYEDVDYGLRIKKSGFRNIVYSGIQVLHKGQAETSKIDLRVLQGAKHHNLLYFKKKWNWDEINHWTMK